MTTPLSLQQTNAEQVNAILVQRYLEVLNPEELAKIGETETRGTLSGLFLPGVTDAYLHSRFRVMLIGQETRAWKGRLRDLRTSSAEGPLMHDYAQKGMHSHAVHSLKPPHSSKFMQFYDKLHQHLGDYVESPRNAVFWGNLLCVSLNEGSPVRADHIVRLQEISAQLLSIQFEVLRPHVVVFASGWRYDPFIKSAISSYTTHRERMVPKRFWPFTKHGGAEFAAYRVPHPRAHDVRIRQLVLQAVKMHLDQLANKAT